LERDAGTTDLLLGLGELAQLTAWVMHQVAMNFEVVLGARYERIKGIYRGVVSFVARVGSD